MNHKLGLAKLSNFVYCNLHVRPQSFKQLFADKYKTYYPESERKSSVRIFFEQLWQILTKGDYCSDYYFYGLDRKNVRKNDYVYSYWEFRKRRDYLNLKEKRNSASLLFNKFYFGQYAASIGGGVSSLLKTLPFTETDSYC